MLTALDLGASAYLPKTAAARALRDHGRARCRRPGRLRGRRRPGPAPAGTRWPAPDPARVGGARPGRRGAHASGASRPGSTSRRRRRARTCPASTASSGSPRAARQSWPPSDSGCCGPDMAGTSHATGADRLGHLGGPAPGAGRDHRRAHPLAGAGQRPDHLRRLGGRVPAARAVPDRRDVAVPAAGGPGVRARGVAARGAAGLRDPVPGLRRRDHGHAHPPGPTDRARRRAPGSGPCCPWSWAPCCSPASTWSRRRSRWPPC